MTTLELLGRIAASWSGLLVLLTAGVTAGVACTGRRRFAVYATPGFLWLWGWVCLCRTDFFRDPGLSLRIWIQSLGLRVLGGAAIIVVAGPLGAAAASGSHRPGANGRRGALFGLVVLGPFGAGLAASGLSALRSMIELSALSDDRTFAFHRAVVHADRLLSCGALTSLAACVLLAASLLRSSERDAARSGGGGASVDRAGWCGPLSPRRSVWTRFVPAAWGLALTGIATLVVGIGVELRALGFFDVPRMAPGWWHDPETWLDRDAVAAILLVVASHGVPYFVGARRVPRRYGFRFGEPTSYRESSAPDRVLLNRESVIAAERSRAAVGACWSMSLSMAVALVGASHAVQPFHAPPNAELFVYFALSLVCLLSHGPRCFQVAAGSDFGTAFATAARPQDRRANRR